MRVLKKSGLLLFFWELFKSPKTVGAAVPSSRKLSSLLAEQIPLSEQGLIVELGPGTGVVSKALLKRGFKEQQLVLIERSRALAKHLQKTYPNIKVICGDAKELTSLLGKDIAQVNSMISSLPLRSLKKEDVAKIFQEIAKVLKPGSHFIQFTYSWRKCYPHLPEYLERIDSRYVWVNIPPARIDVFQYSPPLTQ